MAEDKGGLFVVSTNIGTRFWDGEVPDDVRDSGSMEHLRHTELCMSKSRLIPKNELVFMTSNTPHETLKIPKGTRRTFMRLTLNHNYDNKAILEAYKDGVVQKKEKVA